MSNEIMNATQPVSLSTPQKGSGGQLSVFSNAESFNLAARMAAALAESTVVPKAYQGNVGNCMIAIEMASRINTSPMMVMQNLYIVNGNPAWSSQWIIAMINSSKRYKTELQFEFGNSPEDGGLSCRAWAEDYSGHKVTGPKITMNMAKEEGWLGKSGSKWKTMPEVMIRYRAASFFGRVNCPDMIMGIYSQEEVYDMGDIIDADYSAFTTNPETGEIVPSANPVEDPPISQEQRQMLFKMVRDHFEEDGDAVLKQMLQEEGYESTTGLPSSVFGRLTRKVMELIEARKEFYNSGHGTTSDPDSEDDPAKTDG